MTAFFKSKVIFIKSIYIIFKLMYFILKFSGSNNFCCVSIDGIFKNIMEIKNCLQLVLNFVILKATRKVSTYGLLYVHASFK